MREPLLRVQIAHAVTVQPEHVIAADDGNGDAGYFPDLQSFGDERLHRRRIERLRLISGRGEANRPADRDAESGDESDAKGLETITRLATR